MEGQTHKYRLLVVNPNANPTVTAQVQRSADRVLGHGWIAQAINHEDSPHSIQTPADRNLAEPYAIDLLSRNQGYDAYVMACFDDIAVHAGRRFLRAPVVDPVEASVAIARQVAHRFTIVTTVETMVPGIQLLLDSLGAGAQCTVRAAGVSVSAAAAGTTKVIEQLNHTMEMACDVDGAEAIILGSGGLTGHAALLRERYGLPVIDCIEAAVLLAVATTNCLARPEAADA